MEISGLEFAKEVVSLYQSGKDFKTSLEIVEKQYKQYLKDKNNKWGVLNE